MSAYRPDLYGPLFRYVLTRIDPERAHRWGFVAIRLGTPWSWLIARRPRAPRNVMGLEFPHPFGLAAGFDKDARGVLGLLALGFGHVEVGTVTGEAQPGNPRPRLFRLPGDRAIVNRMGFNNDGATVVAERLRKIRRTRRGRHAVIGVNIGKTKRVPVENAVADYVASAMALSPHASYLVVNVSSPNTPGLRDLQAVSELRPLLTAVKQVTDDIGGAKVPLVVKIAPDLVDEDIDAVVDLAIELGLDGICAANTTIARPTTLRTPRETIDLVGDGGLSGPILADRSVDILRRVRARAGDRLAVISVGGIETPDDVRQRLEAGADLVQAYSGFVYGGPWWPSRMAAAGLGEPSRR